MDGWIKLHRKLLKSQAWRTADAEGKVILVTLLLQACHAITQWRINESKTAALNPGELFITYRGFSKICGVSTKKLMTEFKRLTTVGFLTCRSKKEGTIVQIRNWDKYQIAETRLETPLETTQIPVTDCAAAQKKSRLETRLETPLETHNKIYILIKNKLNKTTVTPESLEEAAVAPQFLQALDEYNQQFSAVKYGGLTTETIKLLQAFAVTTSPFWVLQAVRELKAAHKGKGIRNPQNYLSGILLNWLRDGLPNAARAEAQQLEDFYREEGVI